MSKCEKSNVFVSEEVKLDDEMSVASSKPDGNLEKKSPEIIIDRPTTTTQEHESVQP